MRPSVLLALALFLCVLATPALAGEARTIALPREGLSLDLPDGWSLDLYGDAVLEAGAEGATLRVNRATDAAPAASPWTPMPPQGARRWVHLERDDVVVFVVECVIAEDSTAAREWVDRVLASFETSPYRHADRHVDWSDGWTLDVPAGWTRKTNDRHIARFESADGSARLEVEDLASAVELIPPARMADQDIDQQMDKAWRAGLAQVQQEFGLKAIDASAPVIEEYDRDGSPARRVTLALDPGADGDPRAWLTVVVIDGLRGLGLVRGAKDVVKGVEEALATLSRRLDPGPLASVATPTDRLPGEQGPPVAFTLPEGWSLEPGSNSMRLAQTAVGQAEIVVFYFGVGGGGGISDNLQRWRGQMGGGEGTSEVRDVADDVKVHWLDVSGTYSAQRMGGGNPHNPHGGPASQGGQRMLAAVLEVPEGPLFIKFVGPTETVDEHADAFRAWVDSFRVAR